MQPADAIGKLGNTACTMAHRMARHIGDIVSALTWDRQYCPSDPKENSKYCTADRGKNNTPYPSAENTGSSLSQKEILPFGHQEKVA